METDRNACTIGMRRLTASISIPTQSMLIGPLAAALGTAVRIAPGPSVAELEAARVDDESAPVEEGAKLVGTEPLEDAAAAEHEPSRPLAFAAVFALISNTSANSSGSKYVVSSQLRVFTFGQSRLEDRLVWQVATPEGLH